METSISNSKPWGGYKHAATNLLMGTRSTSNFSFFHGLGSTGIAFGELANYLPAYHIVSFDLPGYGYASALTEEAAYLPSNVIVSIEKMIKQQLGNKNFYLRVLDRNSLKLLGG